MSNTIGTLVEKLKPNVPGEKGGLKSGDVITQFNGRSITTGKQFQGYLNKSGPGTSVTLTIWRSGHEEKLAVVLGARPKRKK